MKSLPSKKKTYLAVGALGVLLIVQIVSFLCTMEYFDREANMPVSGALPDGFPVLVRYNNHARIVIGSELQEFTQKNQPYSLLVPQSDKANVIREVENDTRSTGRTSSELWAVSIKIEDISVDRQRFIVDATFDDDRVNVGEYEATDKEIVPKFYKFYFGPGYVFKALPIATAITVGTGLLMLATYFVVKRSAPGYLE